MRSSFCRSLGVHFSVFIFLLEYSVKRKRAFCSRRVFMFIPVPILAYLEESIGSYSFDVEHFLSSLFSGLFLRSLCVTYHFEMESIARSYTYTLHTCCFFSFAVATANVIFSMQNEKILNTIWLWLKAPDFIIGKKLDV